MMNNNYGIIGATPGVSASHIKAINSEGEDFDWPYITEAFHYILPDKVATGCKFLTKEECFENDIYLNAGREKMIFNVINFSLGLKSCSE